MVEVRQVEISPWQNQDRTVWPWSQTATCTVCLRHTAAREAVQDTCTDRSASARPPDRMPGLFWWTQQTTRVSEREPQQLTGKCNSVHALACSVEAYPRKRLRYCRLQVDQKKTPLFPARVGDIMLPSVLRQGFPSPSWIIPKLEDKINSFCRDAQADVISPLDLLYFTLYNERKI